MNLSARVGTSFVALLFVATGCSEGAAAGVGGSGGANTGGAGGGASLDGGVDAPPVDDASTGDDVPTSDDARAMDAPPRDPMDVNKNTFLVTILVDDFEAVPRASIADASDDASTADDAGRWSLHRTFDSDTEGAEIVAGLPGEERISESLSHGALDAHGFPSSGSLSVNRAYDIRNEDSGLWPTYVRLFSAPSGAPLDGRGYRLSANFYVIPDKGCFTEVYFYVRAGSERTLYKSNVIRLISSRWVTYSFDIPVTTTSADLSQIDEIGLTFARRNECLPI